MLVRSRRARLRRTSRSRACAAASPASGQAASLVKPSVAASGSGTSGRSSVVGSGGRRGHAGRSRGFCVRQTRAYGENTVNGRRCEVRISALLEEHLILPGVRAHAGGGERLGDARVAAAGVGLVVLVPVHRAGADGARDRARARLDRVAAEHDQSRALLGERRRRAPAGSRGEKRTRDAPVSRRARMASSRTNTGTSRSPAAAARAERGVVARGAGRGGTNGRGGHAAGGGPTLRDSASAPRRARRRDRRARLRAAALRRHGGSR